MRFRDRLIRTLTAAAPVLEVPGVVVIGSQVPNLLEPNAASTLVVSEDVDIGVPLAAHPFVKAALAQVRGFQPSKEEPSVWVPNGPELIELNFVGMGTGDPLDTFVFEDPDLPLMVFGPLSFLSAGLVVDADGLRVPLPKTAGLLIEKLLTDRSAEKGDRDRLVVLGLLLVARPGDEEELVALYRDLPPDLQYATRSNLGVLSLMGPIAGMPDPTVHRAVVARLLERLEEASG